MILVNKTTGRIINRNPSLNLSQLKLDKLNCEYLNAPVYPEIEPYIFSSSTWTTYVEQLQEPEYLMYDYISSSNTNGFSNNLAPHHIDYTIEIEPKLKPYRDFRGDGLINNVDWYKYNFETKKDEYLLLNINIEFEKDYSEIVPIIDRSDGQLYNVSSLTGATDPISFEASRGVNRKITKREWVARWYELSGNTNITGGTGFLSQHPTYSGETQRIKTTIKEYNTNIEKRDEGKRRRKNIYMFLEEELVTVLWRTNYPQFFSFDSGSTSFYQIGLALARNDAFGLLTKYKQDIQKYIDESSPLLISNIITDNTLDVGVLLDTTIPSSDPFVMNSNIPSQYYGENLRTLLVDRLLGVITETWVQ